VAAGFTRWPWWRRWFGLRAERAAATFFRRQGYRLLAANYKDKAGELDLIAVDANTLVVIEVRSSSHKPLPEILASVNAEKQRRVAAAAMRYLKAHGLLHGTPVRFDVLAIRWPEGLPQPELQHVPSAFESPLRGSMF
jgi:putative endonuclease